MSMVKKVALVNGYYPFGEGLKEDLQLDFHFPKWTLHDTVKGKSCYFIEILNSDYSSEFSMF